MARTTLSGSVEKIQELDTFPTRRQARQTLDLEMRAKADCDYMQQGSLRGKSQYKWHKKGWRQYLPLGNVVHIMQGSYAEIDDA